MTRIPVPRGGVCMALVATLIAGCGGGGGETLKPAAPTQAPSATAQPVSQAALPAALVGTEWRLVEFQSMDDATGLVRPADPGAYTMRLGADGAVSMRLNCNRASGRWAARSSADETSGSFEFGPLAMTRAFCPPPSMDTKIAADSAYIRGYLLKDGRLYLSLMADGGVYAWEPI